MVHVLSRSTVIAEDIETVWDFFSDPYNLKELVPTSLGFRIVNDISDEMYPGQMFEYTVAPLMKVPLNWLTEITHLNPPFYFVDEQRIGPYQIWHHEHHFRRVAGGTEVSDLVHYKLPMGFVGEIVHELIVKKQLRSIFDYRKARMHELFGKVLCHDSSAKCIEESGQGL